MGFDYGKIAKESFAWYNNKEFWMWGIGFGIISFVLSALYSATIVGMQANLALVLALVVELLVMVVLGAFFSAKLISFALKKREITSNAIDIGSIVKFIGVSIAQFIYCILSLKRPKLIIVTGVPFVLWIVLMGAMVVAPSAFDSGTAIGIIVPIAIMVLTIISVPVLMYYMIRFYVSTIFFWVKKNCSIREAIDLSWDKTEGKVWGVLGAFLLIEVISITIGLAGGLLSLIPLVGIAVGIVLYPAVTGISVYGLVEIYSQLTGAEKKEETPAKKKANPKKKP
ncbi:hypothetical protein AUJ17_01525 [Candidatus Micrarchaeota archaeon CG1_02_47_40]|nr:MAG: hypothetical protein AUJ17_01525 [Candidatus Micrarchaeota archaeon CG1_02_47_40]